MVAATLDAVVELGGSHLTVSAVIARARVSRKTFYEVFRNREDCFLAALEHSLVAPTISLRAAYAGQPSWREGVRAALAGVLRQMEAEPGLARLWIVETLHAGPSVLALRARVLEELAGAIDIGRQEMSADRAQPPAIVAEGVAGAVTALLHSQLLRRGGDELMDLFGPLMYLVVLPYLGPRIARAELGRPASPAPRMTVQRRPRLGDDPVEGLRMRLTYRTVRVLTAIRDRPGVSNRQVAGLAGVTDQGQISKLLNRLGGLGLIENHGAGQSSGTANAWHLTHRGDRLIHNASSTVANHA
jgi:AcrR family transcriptional regulator